MLAYQYFELGFPELQLQFAKREYLSHIIQKQQSSVSLCVILEIIDWLQSSIGRDLGTTYFPVALGRCKKIKQNIRNALKCYLYAPKMQQIMNTFPIKIRR